MWKENVLHVKDHELVQNNIWIETGEKSVQAHCSFMAWNKHAGSVQQQCTGWAAGRWPISKEATVRVF